MVLQKNTFNSVSTIIDDAKKLLQSYHNLEAQRHEHETAKSKELEIIKQAEEQLRSLVFPSDDLSAPTLSPKAIIEVQEELENSLSCLGVLLRQIVEEQTTKSKKLEEMTREQRLERLLFCHFYTNPNHMKKLFTDLSDRVM